MTLIAMVDTNSNGVRDGIEGFLPNVEVSLYEDVNANGFVDMEDMLLETQITDGVGGYAFVDVAALNVVVETVQPYDTIDFSYQATTSLLTPLFLTAVDFTDIDFGIKRTQINFYNISGIVYDDDDQDGLYSGEVGLANVELKMYTDANANGTLDTGESLITTTTTNDNGIYTFSQVMQTHVIVEVVTPEDRTTEIYTATVDTQEAITMLNQNILDVNFGIDKVPLTNYTISGTVYDDDNENGGKDVGEDILENIEVTLYTDSDSNGRISTDDTIIASTTTAADGTYIFTNVTVENTFVAVTVPANTASYIYVLTTSNAIDTSSSVDDITGINFGINKEMNSYEISGNIFNDENADGVNTVTEAGLLNITVNLFEDVNANGRVDRGEPLIGTALSDRSGNYLLQGITASNVIVQLVAPVNTSQFTYTPTTAVSAIVSGGVSTTIDFGIKRQLVILYNISGVIWDDQNSDRLKNTSESRLEGVAVTLYEDVNANGILDTSDRSLSTIATSALGTYQFTNVTLRNVLITPTLPANATFTTLNSRTITSINTDVVNVDFGIKTATALYQVTGVVFNDQNENGVIDAGEDSIDGLPVEIYVDTDASGDLDPNMDLLVAFTQTSNSGFGFLNPNYLVDDVPQGQVFVRVLIPEDTIFSTYTPTFDPDSGTVNPDGVYPTIITSNLTNINFGLKVTQVGARSTASDQGDTMFTNDNAIAVAPEDVSDKLILYPNPTTREIAITTEEFTGEINVEIYNDRGYKVLTKTVSSFANQFTVDVLKLAPGIYYAKFSSRNKVASKKFIKG